MPGVEQALAMTRRAAVVASVAWMMSAPPATAALLAAPETIVSSVLADNDPARAAAGLDEHAVDDGPWLNSVRLGLKAQGHPKDARVLLQALAQRRTSDPVLYNLALSYVDQLPGHNLLNKGYLSTASVRAIDEILQRHPHDWLALHIRGLNNLYWPDWFNRAPTARVDLGRAVEAGQRLLTERPDEDGLAWSYLALGDALALTDHPADARNAWTEGAGAYPYFPALAARIALGDAAQHGAVRAERDSEKPIDTDLDHLANSSDPGHELTLTGGTLFGPGPLDDQALPHGGLINLHLARPLTGTIPQFNNGTGEPHMPGEIAVGKALDGRFSDGTPVNKNIDVGHVILMNGKFKLFLAATGGGPNRGVVHFYLDRFWNWTIQDDIGIDPGFIQGVIKFQNFTFSTSPRILPASTQTQNKEPGGVDRAGSLTSGMVVAGLLGDDDGDGRLAGTFNAIGSFPLDSVLLPGAPFAQTRVFRTDIIVSPQVAGFLTLANAISFLRAEVAVASDTEADETRLDQTFRNRLKMATEHFGKAAGWIRSLDEKARSAYSRLTAPPEAFASASVRTQYVCDSAGDLSVLGSALNLVRSETDGSRLGALLRCEVP
jgi:hypothetical protein